MDGPMFPAMSGELAGRRASSGQEVVALIVAGAFDGDLRMIETAIESRRSALDALTAASLRPGDRVRTRDVRPRYMCGITGTVESVDGKKVLVDHGRPIGRYGQHVTYSVSLLE